MASKIDPKETAVKLVELVGGAQNVRSVTHCMTRLRFVLIDPSAARIEELKKVKGVLGVVVAGGQTQVVLGANLLPVYSEVCGSYHFKEDAATTENLDKNLKSEKKGVAKVFDTIISYTSSSVTPAVPALVAGGMLKVILLLITLVNEPFETTQTYTILSWIANAPYYFLPIFVSYGAAKKLNATPSYAMMVTAALLTPEWFTMVANGEAVTLLMLPVKLVKYSNSLLPALLIALCAAYLEKFFNKIVPGIFKSLLVGLCTITITGVLAFTILGPIGSYMGGIVSGFFLFVGDHIRWLGIGVLAACLPWLVMMGMHTAVTPFIPTNIADIGFDPVIRPAFLLHNMAEGGACLGVALRTKDAQFRSECLSLAVGCILAGVTEPAIYGVNLRLRKPMIGVMAGGAAGGVVAGLLGIKAYVVGYSTILALPIFVDTIFAAIAGVVVAILAAAAVTFVLGFDENEAAA